MGVGEVVVGAGWLVWIPAFAGMTVGVGGIWGRWLQRGLVGVGCCLCGDDGGGWLGAVPSPSMGEG